MHEIGFPGKSMNQKKEGEKDALSILNSKPQPSVPNKAASGTGGLKTPVKQREIDNISPAHKAEDSQQGQNNLIQKTPAAVV